MLLTILFPLLLIACQTFAAQIPVPTPTATPAPGSTAPITQPTLAPRCNDGNCEYGNSATTLQAATVTSTIMSVTSVPCYTTVYVTNEKTTTETIYSTETVTKTETREGTVSPACPRFSQLVPRSIF